MARSTASRRSSCMSPPRGVVGPLGTPLIRVPRILGLRRLIRVSEFTEVGDRVWVARYEWYDVNVTVVEGGAGLLVADTHASLEAGRSVLSDVRRLSSAPVVGVV